MTTDDAPRPWFIDHLERYVSDTSHKRETELLGRAMALFHLTTHEQTVFPLDTTFPNDLAASACMNRAFRQLEAATVLLSYGFYAEIRNLLRSVYESAGLGRTLAKEPWMADKWLRKGQWWPDRKVRDWLEENRVVQDAQPFRNYYKEASAWVHPTAASCLPGFAVDESAITWDDAPPYRPDLSRQLTMEITSTAVFACFAFRNAVVDEAAIPPEWRRDLFELAEAIDGGPHAHLERDWEAEQERYDALVARVRDAAEAEEVLRSHPRAWKNLQSPVPNADDH
ncbi:hypothetical protein [Streptomyces sp. 8N616]|uniref:hypothetical protein n=1 Tax=Streptomyces sp. 8N616 TaxID=3457414 RepID=UPI003FD5A9C6